MTPRSPLQVYVALALLSGILFFGMLGASSLWDIDETSNATAAREMLASGDYVVPTLDGELRTDKPPFHYWCMTVAYRVFGVEAFGARFFAAVFGLLTVLMTAAAGVAVFGPSAGYLAGLILASSFLFTVSSRSATTDAFLVFFSNAAVLAGFFAGRRRAMALLCWGAMGMAVLAKGPVGIVLPAGALGLYYMVRRRSLTGWRPLLHPGGILLFVAIAAPWYFLAAARTGGDLLSGFLMKHNVGRFLSSMESHRGPFFYYLAMLLPGFYPWAPFLPQSLSAAWRRWREDGAEEEDGPGLGLLLLIWAGLELIFFSVARTKLPTYTLPAYPALALLTAAWAAGGGGHESGRRGRTASWWAAALCGLIWPALFAAVFYLRMPRLLPHVVLTLPLAAAGAAGLYWHIKGIDTGRIFARAALVTAAGAAVVHMALVPAMEPFRMAPAVGKGIAASSVPGDRAAQTGFFRPAIVFYGGLHLERLGGADDIAAFVSRPGGRFLVATGERFSRLPEDLKEGFSVLVQGRDAADSDREILLLEWEGERSSTNP